MLSLNPCSTKSKYRNKTEMSYERIAARGLRTRLNITHENVWVGVGVGGGVGAGACCARMHIQSLSHSTFVTHGL